MAQNMPIAEQVRIAGELAYRAEVFHAVWFAIASREGRSRYGAALAEHADILVMTQAAHMSALIVTLYSLFEKSAKTVNLPNISKQLEHVAVGDLERCIPMTIKVARLRHNIFAHRSGKLSKEDVFKLAGISSNDMRWLAGRATAISRKFHRHLELPAPPEAIGARAAIENLLAAVERDAAI